MKALLIICGLGASGGSFLAGVYLLSIQSAGENSMFEAIAHGIGIYFIAKSFFLGPVLFGLAALQNTSRSVSTEVVQAPPRRLGDF